MRFMCIPQLIDCLFPFIDHSSAKHDHGLVSMLRAGLLALQLLPSNTSAGLVVITDCITGEFKKNDPVMLWDL